MPCKTPTGMDATLVSMQTSDRHSTLRRLRDRLAEEIDATDSQHNLERMAARLQSVMAEIDELAVAIDASAADQIAARRAQRRAGRSKSRGAST